MEDALEQVLVLFPLVQILLFMYHQYVLHRFILTCFPHLVVQLQLVPQPLQSMYLRVFKITSVMNVAVLG